MCGWESTGGCLRNYQVQNWLMMPNEMLQKTQLKALFTRSSGFLKYIRTTSWTDYDWLMLLLLLRKKWTSSSARSSMCSKSLFLDSRYQFSWCFFNISQNWCLLNCNSGYLQRNLSGSVHGQGEQAPLRPDIWGAGGVGSARDPQMFFFRNHANVQQYTFTLRPQYPINLTIT